MDPNPYQPPTDMAAGSPTLAEATLPRPIVLRGSMPVRDVLHTQLLILSRRWIYVAICLGLYVAFVIALGLLNSSNSLFGNTFMTLGFIVMPAILPFSLLMVWMRLVRDSKKKVGIFAVTETLLSQQGINSALDEKKVTLPWTAFSSFLCSSRVVILFLNESNNHFIVSRSKLVAEEDWPLLLDFLHARFPHQ